MDALAVVVAAFSFGVFLWAQRLSTRGSRTDEAPVVPWTPTTVTGFRAPPPFVLGDWARQAGFSSTDGSRWTTSDGLEVMAWSGTSWAVSIAVADTLGVTLRPGGQVDDRRRLGVPAFDDHHRVTGDPLAIAALLGPEALAACIDARELGGVTLEHGHARCHVDGTDLPALAIAERLDAACGVLRRLVSGLESGAPVSLLIERVRRSEDAHARARALVALIRHARSNPDVIDLLTGLLDDGSRTLRLLAVRALLDAPVLLPGVLEAALAEGDDETCARALLRIAIDHRVDRRADVERLVGTARPGLAQEAVRVLGTFGDDGSMPVILGALQNDDTRDAALEVLGRIGGPEALVAVVGLLKSGVDSPALQGALVELRSRHGVESVGALSPAEEDGRLSVAPESGRVSVVPRGSG